MEIIWHGYSCFSIKTKEGVAIINPYKSDIGLKLPPLKANMVLLSGEISNYASEAITGNPKILNWTGEYEVAGIAITAQTLSSEQKKGEQTMFYILDTDGLKICYLTDLDVSFTEEVIENIGEVDVLILPVGTEKNSYKQAHQVIEEIEPRSVIPMYYKTPGLKVELEPIDDFAKQAGLTNIQPKDKFVLTSKSDLPEEKTEYIILNPQTA